MGNVTGHGDFISIMTAENRRLLAELKPSQPKWEYEFFTWDLYMENESIRDILRDYGEDGWELVSTQFIHKNGAIGFFFKRQKVEE